jgi:hypothetical protein
MAAPIFTQIRMSPNIYTNYLDIIVVFLYYVVQLGNIIFIGNNGK